MTLAVNVISYRWMCILRTSKSASFWTSLYIQAHAHTFEWFFLSDWICVNMSLLTSVYVSLCVLTVLYLCVSAWSSSIFFSLFFLCSHTPLDFNPQFQHAPNSTPSPTLTHASSSCKQSNNSAIRPACQPPSSFSSPTPSSHLLSNLPNYRPTHSVLSPLLSLHRPLQPWYTFTVQIGEPC